MSLSFNCAAVHLLSSNFKVYYCTYSKIDIATQNYSCRDFSPLPFELGKICGLDRNLVNTNEYALKSHKVIHQTIVYKMEVYNRANKLGFPNLRHRIIPSQLFKNIGTSDKVQSQEKLDCVSN